MRPFLNAAALRGAARAPRFSTARQGPRMYSVKATSASKAKLQDIDPRKLQISKVAQPKALSKPEDLVFGRQFTGMMIRVAKEKSHC